MIIFLNSELPRRTKNACNTNNIIVRSRGTVYSHADFGCGKNPATLEGHGAHFAVNDGYGAFIHRSGKKSGGCSGSGYDYTCRRGNNLHISNGFHFAGFKIGSDIKLRGSNRFMDGFGFRSAEISSGKFFGVNFVSGRGHYSDILFDYTNAAEYGFENFSDELEARNGEVVTRRCDCRARGIFVQNIGEYLGRAVLDISGRIHINIDHLLSSAGESRTSGNRKVTVFSRNNRLRDLRVGSRFYIPANRYLAGNFVSVCGLAVIFSRVEFI